MGSSPLARGTRPLVSDKISQGGLIPARAGNTRRSLHGGRSRRAHPRSRGEHFVLSARLLWRMGSSPLARGTRPLVSDKISQGGLIPARAGNTTRQSRPGGAHRAHPRSRGEHPILVLISSRRAGSSPLARGTPGFISIKHDATGLIPARAGNTVWGGVTIRTIRAHPRSRGEHR